MPIVRYQPAADDEGSSNGDPSVSPPPDDLADFGMAAPFTITTTGTTGTPDYWNHWRDSWSTGATTIQLDGVTISTARPDVWGPPVSAEVLERRQADQAERDRLYEEQRAERQRQREAAYEQRQREYQETLVRRAEAQVRAEELLRLTLLPDELRNFEQTGRIVVTGSDGRRYRINDGVVSNIYLLADPLSDGSTDNAYRGRLAALCAHPNLNPGYDEATGRWRDEVAEVARDHLPNRDAHVGQILALRHDAPSVWRRANVDWYDFGNDAVKLQEWCHVHKFRGSDTAVDTEGLSDEARAAFPVAAVAELQPAQTTQPAQAQPARDERGRFARTTRDVAVA